MRKQHLRFSFMVLLLIIAQRSFCQQNNGGGFNASYWNAYADKLQLKGADKAEFLSAHKKQNSQAPISLTIPSASQAPMAQKTFTQVNNTMAGPCINADFEQGTFNGWVRSSGYNPGFNAIGCCTTAGGQQLIMSGAGTDPFGGFPVVFPGGNFSLRLGDPVNGGFADRIEQTFLVSPSNANFSYKYAVVLEDPNHPISQQPSFQVEMVDSLNNQVPCTYFYVAAGQNIPGFFNSSSPGVIYKPWTTVLLDLTPYIGQNLTIRFTTFDCSLGGHFGYAYIDGVCQSFVGGGSATVCAGSTNTFCAPNGLASYMWNGPSTSSFVGQCLPCTAPGVYTVQTTLFSNCGGPAFTYTLTTQNSPTANAGPNQTVCANNNVVSLSGSITGFTSTPQWLSSGTGTFANATSLITTYTPSAADMTSGAVTLSLTTLNNGVCPANTDVTQITILQTPTVMAGADQTICATSSAALNATVVGATNTGSWTTSGTGTFSPSNSILNPTYFPSAADMAAGSVTLQLFSTNNQACFGVSDSKVIFIQKPPLANAGLNPTVCANNSTVNLSGAILNYTNSTPVWSSSGTGAFTSSTSLNTNYIPSALDISNGGAVITLSTANNGVCPASTSTVQLNITQAPIVSAGPSQTLCSTSAVSLNGNVSGPTTTGFWTSSGSGTFSPSPNTPVTSYNPSAADILGGTVIFTLTSLNNGNCIAVTSTMSVAISKIATVSAGPNQAICSNTNTLALSGTINGATSTGFWTSNGSGGYNPGQGFLNTNYFLSTTDILNGSVIYTLTSTNNGPCPSVSDTVMMKIVPLAQVVAGPNQFVCQNQGTIALTGNVTTGNGAWSSSGSGAYSPSNLSFTTSYAITAADAAAGFVTFTLSSTLNGPCPMVQDSVRINVRRLAVVNAGISQAVCSNSGTLALNGNVTVGSNTGFWTSNGSGAHNPGPGFLTNIYFITANDVSLGLLNFTLTSTNNGPCPSVVDTVSVRIFTLSQVSAGANQLLCEKTGSVVLSGTISTGSGSWGTAGTGIFSPSNTNLNTTYFFGSTDVVNGSVTFTLSSSNNGPCAIVGDTVKVNIRRMAVVNAGASQTICSTSSSVAISGSVTVGSTQGLWTSLGTGNFMPSPTSLNTNYVYSGADLNAGNVTLVLTSLANGVCPPASDSVKVYLSKDPLIDLQGDTSVCSYQNPIGITANLSGNYGGLIWSSSSVGGSFVPGAFVNPVKYKFAPNDILSGLVTLSVSLTNNGPCASKTGTILINVRPSPIAGFAASSYTIFNPADPIVFTNTSQLASTYSWNFGDGNQSDQTHPTHTYPGAGYYTVNLIAANQYSCTDTAQAQITIKSDIKFPNAFTPNGGGSNGGTHAEGDYSNDVFFPITSASGVTEYDLKIFNRYGELIFQSTDVKIGWDGYFNGKLCQQDAYVWKANVTFFDGATFKKTGSVSLIR
jgi:gliding motility-associated-like protein